jgi:hypothetical protein
MEPTAEHNTLSVNQVYMITAAYNRAKKLFGSMELVTGVHSLPLDVVLELVRLIDMKPNEVSWEIGCGELLLAFGLSSATNGGVVVATDLCEIP